jgi:hypothetical protein
VVSTTTQVRPAKAQGPDERHGKGREHVQANTGADSREPASSPSVHRGTSKHSTATRTKKSR